MATSCECKTSRLPCHLADRLLLLLMLSATMLIHIHTFTGLATFAICRVYEEMK